MLTSHILGRYNAHKSRNISGKFIYFAVDYDNRYIYTSYKLDIGAQYTQVFGKKHEATLGVVFSPGHDLNNDSYVEDRLGNEKTGTTVNNRDTVAAFGSPMSLGVGFSYVYDKRLTGRG